MNSKERNVLIWAFRIFAVTAAVFGTAVLVWAAVYQQFYLGVGVYLPALFCELLSCLIGARGPLDPLPRFEGWDWGGKEERRIVMVAAVITGAVVGLTTIALVY